MESTKKTIRRTLSVRRAALDAETIALAGRILVAHLGGLREYVDAAVLLAYVAKDNEVPTGELIADARRRGKQVFLPRIEDRWFARWREGARLSRSPVSTLEPLEGEPLGRGEKPGIVLVPLLAWTAAGDRLGRGGGWYDRVLPGLGMAAIGAGYEFQEREHVPTEPCDVRLDYVVTEDRLIECGRVPSARRLA